MNWKGHSLGGLEKVLDQQWSTKHMGVCTFGNSLNCTLREAISQSVKTASNLFIFFKGGGKIWIQESWVQILT